MATQVWRDRKALIARALRLVVLVCAWAAAQSAAADNAPEVSAAPQAASADVQRYTVQLDAPEDTDILLRRYLELIRRQFDADIDRDQIEVLADRARRQARALLNTEGYFAPEIESEIDFSTTPWTVRLKVVPGQAVHVERLDIEYVGATAEDAQRAQAQWQLTSHLGVKPGDRFRQEGWDDVKTAVLRPFLLDRFPQARIVQSRARIDPDALTALLWIQVDAGPSRTFGPLVIEGLQRYPSRLIQDAARLEVGAPFRQEALLALQAELQSLPQFRSVQVSPDFEHAGPSEVPIRVEVVENPLQRAQVGVGYSSNTGERLQLGYSHTNVAGRGWIADGLLKLERREQSVAASVRLPKRADGWQDSASVSLKHADLEGEVTRTGLLEAKRERKEGAFDRSLALRYYYSVQELQDGERYLARALVPMWSWTHRRLDDLAYPRDGAILSVQLGAAAKGVLTDETFARAWGRWTGIWPIGERDALTTRAELGIVSARDRLRVPADLLFRAGGDQSIRGYSYQSIGVAEGGSIVGGRYLATASLEYTHWTNAQWGMGAFIETGDAFDAPGRVRLHSGIGGGPRWRSPVGPINVDVAWGDRTRQVRLHFALGIVF